MKFASRFLAAKLSTLSTLTLLLSVGATTALASFDGQTILGPLGPGSVATGTTVGHSDDNDGFTSGDHIFNIWTAGDVVYGLDWPGGPLTVTMTYDNTAYDLDLFLYEPGSYNDSGNYSILNSGTELIEAPDAAPGTYYLVIDGGAPTDVGPYTLTIGAIPEPAGAMVLLPAVALLSSRRSRR